jgi:hypothetical protein
MKKKFLMATALLAGSVVFAQQEEKTPPPPPPPPPTIEFVEPPPPPPVPPAPELIMTKDYASFLRRNKQVKQVAWKEDQKVTIHLKSGKSEVYDLSNKGDVKKLEDKYGQLPAGPPPPPPPPPAPAKTSKQQ